MDHRPSSWLAYLAPGIHEVSHVPDASLHAYHALKWTPADPREAHQKRFLCVGFWSVKAIAICIIALTGLYQALGSAVSPAVYVVPCVRFACVVRLSPPRQVQHSV